MTAPNTNRPPTARESKAHKAADRAAAPIGTGAAQVLAVTGVQGGGSGVFGGMASAPGVEEVSDVSAPKGYVPPKYDGPAADAAWVASQKEQEAASGNGGGSNGQPNLLANQMNVAGSLPEPSNVNAVKGAVSFPGSGGAASVKRSMYPTNDAGTGPAPVPGGGFSPIGGGERLFDGTPVRLQPWPGHAVEWGWGCGQRAPAAAAGWGVVCAAAGGGRGDCSACRVVIERRRRKPHPAARGAGGARAGGARHPAHHDHDQGGRAGRAAGDDDDWLSMG